VCREQRGFGGRRIVAGGVCLCVDVLGQGRHFGHGRVGSAFLRCRRGGAGAVEEGARRPRALGVGVGTRGNLGCVFEAVLQERQSAVLVCLWAARGVLTPDLSEPDELVGRLCVSSAVAGSAMVDAAGCDMFKSREWPSVLRRESPGAALGRDCGYQGAASSRVQVVMGVGDMGKGGEWEHVGELEWS
jgi:hypothetical protein